MEEKWLFARKLRRASTDAERKLWYYLRRRTVDGCRFRRQYPIDRFVVDFVCVERMLVVEVDGGQHAEAVAYDTERTQRLHALGYRVLRFWDDDVLLRMADVVDEIFRWIQSTPPQPSPVAQGRGK